MADRIQQRRDILSNWETVNPILSAGEPAWVTDRNKRKIGDGTTQFNDLPWETGEPEGWVNVKDFGAKGDGITDDTQAIQDAINYLSSGQVLFFPKGSYLITSTLFLDGKSRIYIYGNYSSIKTPSTMDIIVFDIKNGTNIHIEGFYTSHAQSGQTFIKANGVHHLHISEIEFDGTKLGFDISYAYWLDLSNIRFQASYQAFNLHDGVNTFNLNNVSIHGNTDTISSRIYNNLGGIIKNCSFEHTSALQIDKTMSISIIDNYFEDWNQNIASFIEIGSGNFKTTYAINITGNNFLCTDLNTTTVTSSITLYNVGGISITGNSFKTPVAVRLVTQGSSDQEDIFYVGNRFLGNNQEIIKDGIDQPGSLSPVFKAPIIFDSSFIPLRPLETNQTAIFDENGALRFSQHNVIKQMVGLQELFGDTIATGSSIDLTINNGLQFGLLKISTIINADAQIDGLYLIVRDRNDGSRLFITPISAHPEITLTNTDWTITVTNTDTTNRYTHIQLIS